MRNPTWTFCVGALLVCAGCQTVSLSNPELESARESYRTAQADPRVQRYAPVEINRARETLQEAETEWRENGNTALASHLAYIARQRALTATELGVRGYAEEQIKFASAQRDQLIALARARDSSVAERPATEAPPQALSAAQRTARLEAELAALQAHNTDRGVVVTLSDVVFDAESARLRPSATPALDRIANALRDNPERRVMIEGFTDSQGLDARNLDLSARRAGAVRQALVDRGISPQRIDAQGLGESYPVATNSTVTGRQLNRRVEILFSDAQGHLASRPMRGSYGSQPRR
jgi:outer membrane protein OmpA-like peptidoglycan-associated protein